MQSNAPNSQAADLELGVNDLGPLAWVLEELRKSLESAVKALKRFVRDAEMARGSDLAALDSSQLRIARQQLHQSVGALEMVGLPAPALLLKAMETAVQRFVQQPENCTTDSSAKLERASFALTEYLQGVLSGRPVSSVSLFPQYREIQEIVRADRIHPADLWPHEWRWLDPQFPEDRPPRDYGLDSRAAVDQAMLRLMKGKAAPSAQILRDLCLGFSSAQAIRQPKIFWKIAAAFFEALAHDLLEPDVYVKRATSRVLLQYASLAKGGESVSDRLAQDLVFFCAQSRLLPAGDTPLLAVIRSVYGLNGHKFVDYELVQFGRFDPATLAQARKRIASAKETWSALSAGDLNKFKNVSDQFSLVSDSLVKLHPSSEPLAQALARAVENTVRLAQPPRIELAMEVATSVMYLEAAFEDLDPSDPLLAVRTRDLADRLEGVRAGGEPQPLKPWMEELYGRVSDKQTMGSVVGELRISLGELEKGLDSFFRDPTDKSSLQAVPAQLSQMRGVLSVLGLDQAAHTVLRMRDSVEQMLETDVDAEQARAAGTFDRLGNNVGSLSFLIDMLNYQPSLTKKLFIFDEEKGELKPIMGRVSKGARPASGEQLQDAPSIGELLSAAMDAPVIGALELIPDQLPPLVDSMALLNDLSVSPEVLRQDFEFGSDDSGLSWQEAVSLPTEAVSSRVESSAETAPGQFDEDDLQEIFLEEAREVTMAAKEALSRLSENPADTSDLTILRRAFHTLKGSSRMVGLKEFGDAAWSFEQLNNSWLADQKPANDTFRLLTLRALAGFESWIAAIASRQDSGWSSLPFSTSADAMRASGDLVALVIGDAVKSLHESPGEMPASAQDLSDLDLELGALQGHAPDHKNDANTLGVVFSASQLPGAKVESEPHAEIAAEGFSITGIDFAGLSGLPEVTFEEFTATPLTESRMRDYEAQAISAVEFGALLTATAATNFEALRSSVAASKGPEVLASQLDGLNRPGVSAEIPASQSGDRVTTTTYSDDTAIFVVPGLAEVEFDTPSMLHASADSDASGSRLTAHGVIETEEDEQVKVIGLLRIGIPLYNVYLNEADEWSRRLVTEVSEWALEADRSVSDSTVALAHSLAGSSATVGFHALSNIARMFEHALQKSQSHYSGQHRNYSTLFVDTSEEIRRLLHQFAAGFLKQANESLLEQLKDLDFPDSLTNPANELLEFDNLTPESTARFMVAEFDEPPVSLLTQPTGAVGPIEVIFEREGLVSLAELSPSDPAAALNLTIQPTLVRHVAAPAPLAVVFDHLGDDDGIDAVDVIDRELFPIFEEEAAELMPHLGGALRQWSARPDNQSARMEVMRDLHTLKGSSRLAGAMRLGELVHRIESQIESLGSEPPPLNEFDELLTKFDAMQGIFDGLRFGGSTQFLDAPVAQEPSSSASKPKSGLEDEIAATPVDRSAEIGQLPDDLQGQSHSKASDVATSEGLRLESLKSGSELPLDQQQDATLFADAAAGSNIAIPPPQAMVMTLVRQAAGASVRVRSQLLDRMVNQAGEVMITRSRLEAEMSQLRGSLGDMSTNLNRLRQHLRDIELQAETQMQSRLAQAKEAQADFDPLEIDRFTRIQELTRMMAESVNDVATVQRTLQRTVEATEDDLIAQARQTRELQRDLLRTRMVEFESIADRLYRVVRQASKDTGKQVKLDLLGGNIEMDRGMLDRMTPAFEHLLRNCVAHGVEDQKSRDAAGKNPVGLITVHLRHEGNDVSVDFSDDGGGLDIGRIRERAVAQGMIDAAAVLTAQEAADLIFLPGFTTATQITELAGRGIGMDVVRSEVHALGGRIETSTVLGQGTHFKLVLPLTTAVTQVVLIRSGQLSIGVPANLIETVRRVSPNDLQAAYKAGTFDIAGVALPFFWSGTLLQTSRHSVEAATRTLPVIIFRSADQRLALHVDEVVGNQEVVVKNLGPQMSRLPGLSGMSVLASGAVVLIYNLVALAAIYGVKARAWAALDHRSLAADSVADGRAPVAIPDTQKVPLVLVVDDSITVRRVTQRLLQREGFRVAMAADGLQALERLQEELPSVVLSDIEMPRMDGFDLARNIRADARLKGLPIIMITSRIAEKHREHAMVLGVDNYLGKPYSEDELVGLVRHYCAAKATLAA